MEISYKWLKRYIDVNESPAEIAEILTSIGLEVGTVKSTVADLHSGLRVAEVVECEPHPDSDHMHVTKVDAGTGELVQVVCGAANCRKGLKTIMATIGTELPDGDKKFVIKKSKLRGVESYGMLCAEDEIGIGCSHDGIIELPSDVKVGTLAKDFYATQGDTIIEVDITPNRSDAISHYGVARDLNAYFTAHGKNYTLTRPDISSYKKDYDGRAIAVEVVNTEACPRYAGVTITDVKVGASPEWLKESVEAIGIRSINNVVDITNYILHGLGQPLHCFDADTIAGGKLTIKTLPAGTKFVTLDGVERELNERDLMICDEEGGSCIAGVFGGLKSGVTEKTTTVFLESAYFNPVYIRKTARRHGLNTDASFRYERGCDPNCNVDVLKYAAILVRDIAGGRISSDIIDIYPEPIKPFDVTVTYDRINSLVGQEIDKDTVKTILKGLEVEIVSENNGELALRVPPYRVDVRRDCDVIEDILRIYGYNNIKHDMSVRSSLSFSPKVNSYKLQNIISEQLTGAGFNEVLNNSLTKSAYYTDNETYPADRLVMLMNPLSQDLNCMRQTLLFGGLENVRRNINHRNPDILFYEFGNCYYFNKYAEQTKEAPLAQYSEDYHLGLWVSGMKTAPSWVQKQEKKTFYTLRAYVDGILARLGVKDMKLKTEEYEDANIKSGLKISSGKSVIITMGRVADSTLKMMEIDQEVDFADINWTNLMKLMESHNVTYRDIPKYPEVKRDLALLIPRETTFAQIEKVARDTEKNYLKDVYLFDVYEGKMLEAGKKSYAVTFILQDENATLTDNQIDKIMQKLMKQFETRLEAKIR